MPSEQEDKLVFQQERDEIEIQKHLDGILGTTRRISKPEREHGLSAFMEALGFRRKR